MNQTFLVEYASRNLAYLLNYGNGSNIPKASCTAMLILAGATSDSASATCTKYPLTDLVNVRVAT